MSMQKYLLIFIFGFGLLSGKPDKLKPYAVVKMNVEEPSDLSFKSTGSMYVVSDKGYLSEIGTDGKTKSTFGFRATDLEGVCYHNHKIYCVDERFRRIYQLNEQSGEVEGSYTVPYAGARNSGYEGICRNESNKKWLLAVEKSPVMLRELNDEFLPGKEIAFPYASDISAVAWYSGFVWILSEEDHKLMKVDPVNYKPLASYDIGVTGAEGLTFDDAGNFYICSDGMSKLYTFKQP